MPLPDSFIEELTHRSSIEELASSYVALRPRGKTLVGLCPFHGEKTPSFTVYPESNSFYCFGCGAGGDIITFVKKIEHLDYLDAVRFLADRAGLEMPRMETDDTAGKLRRRILEANREAARLYHELLYSPQGKEGLDYYHSRGYTDKTIRRFGLGFAPDSFHTLLDLLRKKGFHDEELLAAWLCRKSSKGYLYDSFRNRVMVPIIDVRGNVIAFGGRVLDDSKPKYLNSGDTPVFKKTDNLFALNFAKESGRQLILCEGYMDVIALHQAGFPNAVAALGTSFTADHANLIARYADEAVLIFDSDEAGQKGASRAMALLRNTGVHVRVVRIPDGKDPDEFLRRHPPSDFKLLIERSFNDVEYRLATLKQRYLTDTPDGRIAYLQEAVKILAPLQSAVERDVYAGRLSEELSVSKTAILQQAEQLMKKNHRREQKQLLPQAMRKSNTETERVNPEALTYVRAAAAEKGLLGILLQHPDWIESAAKALPPEDMVTSFNRRLYKILAERQQQGLMIELPLLAASFSEDEMAYIARLWQTAQTLAGSEADMNRYIDIIRQEQALAGLSSSLDSQSDEEVRRMMERLRNMKS
ncbi:MAG: DNA primase [Acutalibacteraceae bacterium]